MNPKFAEDYDSLKRQAKAMVNMINSMEAQLGIYSKKDYALSELLMDRMKNSLESEREMNHKLTNELEESHELIEQLRKNKL